MMSGMYAAIAGLEVNQTMLNVTANNLANVNTTGYKSSSVQFADSLTQVLRGSSSANGTSGGTNPVQVGLGVQVGATENEMSEGAFQSTNNPLNVAIEGGGLLRVGTGAPSKIAEETEGAVPATFTTVDYTRAGNLTTNANGFLTTQSGQYVIGRTTPGTEGKDTYIHIPSSATDVSIGQDGAVTYLNSKQEPKTAGYLSLAKFPNESGLERLGGSLWAQSANSGGPQINTPGKEGFGTTIGGELEMSNVNLASQMTAMITAERGYQANSRVITTADEMLSSAVSMVQ